MVAYTVCLLAHFPDLYDVVSLYQQEAVSAYTATLSFLKT